MSATQTDLFLAILALDAYNRGYNPGMYIPTPDPNNPDCIQIGNATVVQQKADNSIGFYAVAYNWDGQTVISYRGTTFEVGHNTLNDIIYGWSLSAGFAE